MPVSDDYHGPVTGVRAVTLGDSIAVAADPADSSAMPPAGDIRSWPMYDGCGSIGTRRSCSFDESAGSRRSCWSDPLDTSSSGRWVWRAALARGAMSP